MFLNKYLYLYIYIYIDQTGKSPLTAQKKPPQMVVDSFGRLFAQVAGNQASNFWDQLYS